MWLRALHTQGSAIQNDATDVTLSNVSFLGNTGGDYTIVNTGTMHWVCQLGFWMPMQGNYGGVTEPMDFDTCSLHPCPRGSLGDRTNLTDSSCSGYCPRLCSGIRTRGSPPPCPLSPTGAPQRVATQVCTLAEWAPIPLVTGGHICDHEATSRATMKSCNPGRYNPSRGADEVTFCLQWCAAKMQTPFSTEQHGPHTRPVTGDCFCIPVRQSHGSVPA